MRVRDMGSGLRMKGLVFMGFRVTRVVGTPGTC